MTAWYDIGNVKGRPSDYFRGEILKDGKVVCKLFGNYAGYIDFDSVRYWDVREETNYKIKGVESGTIDCIPSDCRLRIDSIALKQNNVEEAQENKTKLETVQRADRKLREAAEKRRHEGGPKIFYYKNHPLYQM